MRALWSTLLIYSALLLCTVVQAQSEESLASSSSTIETTPSAVPNFTVGDLSGLSGMILFGVTIEDKERIYVLDLDAKRVRKVIDGPGNSSYPSWSSDGTRLAFTSDRDGNKEIYIADWDGLNQVRLTNNTVIDDNPSWSFKGDKVIFYSETGAPGGDTNIFIQNAQAGTKAIQVTTFTKRNTTPRFLPGDKGISYSTNRFWPGWDVCNLDLATHKENCVLSGAQTYCRQSYSPDGKWLAYSFGAFDDIDIGVLNLADSNTTALTKMKRREYDVAWDPTSKLIAFAAEDGREEIFNLYAVDLEKKTRTLLTSPYSIRYLSWSGATTIDLEAKRMRQLQSLE